MDQELLKNYLTPDQACDKYSFLNKNRLKNLMFKNPNGFRDKVVRKLGRRNLISEEALLKYLSESK